MEFHVIGHFVTCICAIVALGLAGTARAAEPGDTRGEVAELRRLIEAQDARIAELTLKVARLEAELAARGPAPAPPPTSPASVVPPISPPAAGQPDARATAKRIVFVVDTSGSMIDKLTQVKAFVRAEVDRLAPGAAFNVVVAGDGRAESFQARPVVATAASREELGRALSRVSSSGTSDMIPAMELALKQQPDLIWLVTDGDMPNNDAFLNQLRAENRGRGARINTVAATASDPDEQSASFVQFLKTVAAQHGGNFYWLNKGVLDSNAPARATRRGIASPPIAQDSPKPVRDAQPPDGATRRIVFVLDISAGMDDRLGVVKSEVRKAVAGMSPDVAFNVFAASARQATAFKAQPVAATPAVVGEFQAFLDRLSASGQSEILPAVERCLEQQPDVLWLVTDGEVRDAPAFLDRLRRANPDGRTRINTLVAGDTRRMITPATAHWIKFLSDLASEHGGRCIDLTGTPVDVAALKIDPNAPAAKAPTTRSGRTSKSAVFDDH